MYSIHLSKLRSTSTLFPTQKINIVCVQFETLAKNQNNERIKSILLQEETHLKESSRYDLPLGSKKMAFISRRPQERYTKKKMSIAYPQLVGLNTLKSQI